MLVGKHTAIKLNLHILVRIEITLLFYYINVIVSTDY
jgi:hypothetical protein